MKQLLLSVVVAVVATLVTLYAHDALQERSSESRAGADETGASAGTPPLGTRPAAGGSNTAGAASEDTPSAGQSAPVGLRYTMELVEDAWVNGARTAGIDHKPLAHADTSVCYLTRVQIKGVQGPADSSICRIQVDDFTGFWEVVAEIEEGGQSEVRCNARCLVWEQ